MDIYSFQFHQKSNANIEILSTKYTKNKRALHTQGLAAGVKSGGKFPGGNFPQREMSNVGNYFIMPNFSSFR